MASHLPSRETPAIRDHVAQCQGKSRFPSGTAAFRAASRINHSRRKGGKRNQHAKVYRCPFCGGWHFGREILKEHQC